MSKAMEPMMGQDACDVADAAASMSEIDVHRLRRLIEAASGYVYDWDLVHGTVAWAGGAAAAFGIADLAAAEAIDAERFLGRVSPDDAPVRRLAFDRYCRDGAAFVCEYKLRRDDGRVAWVEETGVADFDADGRPRRLVGMLRPTQERRQREERLTRLAHHDDLTGLANRGRIRSDLDAVAMRLKHDGGRAGFLLINVDNLGAINEGYGHAVADEVIVEIGRRVQREVRSGDALGRVDGNQFGFVVELPETALLADVAERILAAVRDEVVQTPDGPIVVTVSIGGVELPAVAETGNTAFGYAEEALEQAKRGGRDRFVNFEYCADKLANRRRTLANGDKVLAALNERRLKLAFQPIVSSGTGDVRFYECLLRMLDNDGEVVPAARFMPVVEELGLIRMVDRRVLEMALATLQQVPDILLTVNVSGMTASDAATLENIVGMVRDQEDLAPRLTFEITETVAMQDITESGRFISRLRDLGCSVALDDFGAGYTSFRYLKSLAVDLVKIDGQFVQDLASNRENQLFMRTLVDLAQGFDLATVAECVETQADSEAATEFGVDYQQGYLFGRPTLDAPWLRPDAVRAAG
jgi:diguanylate cyclase (GGDEF)-like protein